MVTVIRWGSGRSVRNVPNEDFFIPSLLREVREWPYPSLADPDGPLPAQVGAGPAGAADSAGALVEYVSSLLDSLEPTLTLLAVCGYTGTRLVVAGAATDLAVSLPFTPLMAVTAMPRNERPAEISYGLLQAPAVVALEVSGAFLAVPTEQVRDGWLVMPLHNAAATLDLADVVAGIETALRTVDRGLLDDVERAVGSATVADLAAELGSDSGVNSGLLTMFDPDGWAFASLDPDADTGTDAGDPDAVALRELGAHVRSKIDDPSMGIATFLEQETARSPDLRFMLRDRFEADRGERQLMRRGLRGARNRHRDSSQDGLTRAFRVGRSRRTTCTEFLMGCHVEGVVDVCSRLDALEQSTRWEFAGAVHGGPGHQYVIARLPDHQSLETIEPVLRGAPSSGQLLLRLRRWGQEHDVLGGVDAPHLSLSDGRLAFPLAFIDGPGEVPTLELQVVHAGGSAPDDDIFGDTGSTEVLFCRGVQHGDAFLLTDGVTGVSAEVAIVKNFSRNDMERLHSTGHALELAPPVGPLSVLGSQLTDTIEFLLADGPGTAQDRQRLAVQGAAPQSTDVVRADPASLDIPSARGVGLLPDDVSHVHFGAPDGAIAADVAEFVASHDQAIGAEVEGVTVPTRSPAHADVAFRQAVEATQQAVAGELAQVFARIADVPDVTTLWHSYEAGAAKSPRYLSLGNTLQLWSGDPIRNIRSVQGGEPELLAVRDPSEAWGLDDLQCQALIDVDLFVDRRARVVLYRSPSGVLERRSYGEALQVADALVSLADGGLPPSGVLTPGQPQEPEQPSEPEQPAEPETPVEPGEPDEPAQPEEPGTGLGSVRLRVVDDEGNPLPFAIVTLAGNDMGSAKVGVDGELPLDDQHPGMYLASVTGYPDHDDGVVDFSVTPDTTVDVDLVLARVLPDPGLPTLRGSLAEASGFFVRAAPGGNEQILGKLHYIRYDVTVLEAREIPRDGPPIADLWFRVRFAPDDFERVVAEYEAVLRDMETEPGGLEAIDRHAAAVSAHQGTEAWVGTDALSPVAMPWDHFLALLTDFELEHAGDDLLARLSRIRQMGENPDVPGNDAVGSGHDVSNQITIAERTPDPGRWSLLYETKQVELPDGEIVDIHHFLLGVESLIDDGRRGNDRTVTASYGPFWLNLRLGESYSAATWSGDVGAAVSDLVRHMSDAWEEEHQPTTDENLAFYLRSRSPDFDLLADIDAWGAYQRMPRATGPAPGAPAASSLHELVTSVYGPAGPWTAQHDMARREVRQQGIRGLLSHYGFTDVTGLHLQVAAVARMEEQVQIFSETWYTVTAAKAIMAGEISELSPWPNATDRSQLANAGQQMTPLFLDWLQARADEYDVHLGEEP